MALFVHALPSMLKPFAGSAAVVVAVLGASFIAIACSSSEDSTFEDGEQKFDATDGPISSLVPDSGLDAAKPGPSSCPPAIPAGFTPAWKAPTKAAACSPAQLKEYWAKCLADPTKTEADGSCAAWKAANTTCGDCAEPDDKSGPIQWHLSRKYYSLNIAGCIHVQQQKAELADCGEAYNSAVQCGRESCEFCFGLGGTFEQFRDCQRLVSSEGVCKSYESVVGTKCQGIKNAGEPTLQCFGTGQAKDAEADFTRVVGLLCGQ